MTNQKEFLGHPKGLFVLFFTEMWERFSYYGMRAILVLYMVSNKETINAGLGWEESSALELYGWYTMLVYVMSIPGGWLADNVFGQKKSVLYGGILLCFGHGVLAIEASWAFFTGLTLIVLGVGLLKPNISTMVGGLYKQGDERRDKGFSIFYIGINLGAFFASLIVGYIGEVYGWHYGFGLAGIGMLLGQIVYMAGQKHLSTVGNLEKGTSSNGQVSLGQLFAGIWKSPVSAIITGVFLVASIIVLFFNSIGYGLLFIFLSLTTGVMMRMYQLLESKVDKDRYVVILLSFLLIIVFWSAFEQAGGLMNIYALAKTNRVIGGFEIPASVFQSLNPFYIIALGVPIAAFWAWWKRRGKEGSSLFKMALGVIIMGSGFLFMTKSSMEVEMNGEDVVQKSAMIWLVLAYLFHTVGELCASPVALSFITKLAPVRYASFMMGAYFAATGLGNKVAGSLGEAATEGAGELQIFTGIAIFCMIFGLIVLAMLKPLKRLTHGAEDLRPTVVSGEPEPYEIADEALVNDNN